MLQEEITRKQIDKDKEEKKVKDKEEKKDKNEKINKGIIKVSPDLEGISYQIGHYLFLFFVYLFSFYLNS